MEFRVGLLPSSRAMRGEAAVKSWKRVEQPCALLLKLSGHISRWGINKTAREVARTLSAYFDDEFSRHRESQEFGLFPALRARAQAGDRERLEAVFAQLVTEHCAIEQCWATLREALTEIALCRPARLSADAVGRFSLLYSEHINSEDERLMLLTARVFRVDAGITGNTDRAQSSSPKHRALGETDGKRFLQA